MIYILYNYDIVMIYYVILLVGYLKVPGFIFLSLTSHYRANRHSLFISRYPESFARYTMLKHLKESGNMPNPKRLSMMLLS